MRVRVLCLRAVACAMLLLAAAGTAAPAGAQTPPAASPGGALPKLPDKRRPPSLDDPAAAFPIPPAVERPLDVEQGDRLFVERFRLTGAVDRLGERVDPDEVARLVEQLRVEQQRLDEVGEDGFTGAERAQIKAFMQNVIGDPESGLQLETYQALVERLRAQRAERRAGMTIGQMQQIAAKVTEVYRSAGYILAQAFIPAQEVVDGVVAIEVLEGTLGQVMAEGNRRYDAGTLEKPFEDLVGAPVTAQGIEEAILTAGDYPGVTLFGIFQPGRAVGSSDLVLRVQEEKLFDLDLRFDNHGSRFTGEYRAFANLTFNNLPFTGAADRLSATALRQFNPSNAWYGALDYERSLPVPGTSLGASYSRNPFEVGGELSAANLGGESEIYEAYFRGSFYRSRQMNLNGRLGWRRSREVTEQNDVAISRDDLSLITGELGFDSIHAPSRSLHQALLGFSLGLGDRLGGHGESTVNAQTIPGGRQGGSGKFASNDFFKLFASYSRLQSLTESQSLLLRLNGQWSNDLLTSLEQFGIGGPNSVRAYPVSEFQVDTGVFASAEWIINAPGFADARLTEDLTWGRALRFSIFADWAWGEVNDPAVSQESSVNVSGFGAALSFGIPGSLQGRFEVAHPFNNETPSDGDETRYWFDLTYQF